MPVNDWAAEFNRRAAGSMIADHGTNFRTVTAERTVLELAFKPSLTQLTGIFHAGAIIALADEACTALAAAHAMREGGWDAAKFPLTVQLSANLIRNTNRGTITAEATPLHRGRTTAVVRTEVRDQDAKLLAVITATLVLPSAGAKSG
jgi:uncharacterized protein (TIGR00369 family)